MSGIRLGFLGLALLFAAMLAWGLKTGSMPEKYMGISRARQPVWFWIGGALYALFAIGCLCAAFTAP